MRIYCPLCATQAVAIPMPVVLSDLVLPVFCDSCLKNLREVLAQRQHEQNSPSLADRLAAIAAGKLPRMRPLVVEPRPDANRGDRGLRAVRLARRRGRRRKADPR